MRARYIGILLVLSFLAATAVAQTATPTPPDDGEVIRISSKLVVVPVSVTNEAGLPVTGLTAQDFRLAEDGRAQEIENVSSADQIPLRIALLFDISATTSPMFRFQQETAAKFLLEVMRADDRAAVFTIGSASAMVSGLDTAERAVASVRSIAPAKEATAFFDTVAAAANYLRANSGENSRKVIVVISDGEDTNSASVARAIQDGFRKAGEQINSLDLKKLRELTANNAVEASLRERSRVVRQLQNADTVFYSINPAGSSFHLNKISIVGQENMRTFADDTGGTAFLPRFAPIDTKDQYQNSANRVKNTDVLTGIFQRLANELRSQYLVQFYSESERPAGSFVKLAVSVPTRNAAKVRARQGYFAKD
jgi:Ca-activated chloride channel homolog